MKVSMESLGVNEEWRKRLLFSAVFINENKLQTIFDRYNSEVTSKQWLLMVVTSSFEAPPTLTEVGELMGCSRQNVKKIAVLLENKGYIRLEKKKQDARSLYIILTEKYKEFAINMDQSTDDVLKTMFREFDEKQLTEFFESTNKMARGIEALDKYFSENVKKAKK